MSKGQWTVSIIRQDCCSDMVVQVRKETNVISHIHGHFLFLYANLYFKMYKCDSVAASENCTQAVKVYRSTPVASSPDITKIYR